MPTQFAACSNKSVRYSLLPADKIPGLAKSMGHSSVCLADRGYCAGIPAFLPACKEQGIAPIMGIWLDFPEIRQAQDLHFLIPGDVLLIATDNHALSGLLEISASSQNYYKPYKLQTALKEFANYPSLWAFPATVPALKLFYAQSKGIMYVPVEDNNEILSEASKLRIPSIACLPWNCESTDDHSAMGVLHAQTTNKTWEHFYSEYLKYNRFHLQTPEILKEIFPKELLDNADNLANSCRALTESMTGELQRNPNEEIGSDYTELEKRCWEGLHSKFPDEIPKNYNDQLIKELNTIRDSGFAGIFLVVRDLARYMQEKKYLLGPGRGSAAGSLASHLLGITVPDPLKEGLWFERFLNPDRISPPDFDLDIPSAHQEEAQLFVQHRWQTERSAPISSWTAYKTRSGFKAAARARGIPNKAATEEIQRIEDNEHAGSPPSLRLQQCWEDTTRLEGSTQDVSRHPGGIALFARPWTGSFPVFTPEVKNKRSPPKQVLQFDYEEVEALGAVKIDLLSLRNLDSIQHMASLAKIEGSPWDIPRDDPEVFREISAGNTLGVFQLSGPGITEACRAIQPSSMDDLQAIVALYRKGPMINLPAYIRRKQGLEEPKPPHPLLEEICKETLGIVIYQEQVLRTVVRLADFPPGKADTLRKAIGKKTQKDIPELKKLFQEGCKKKGIAYQDAVSIWKELEHHTGYSFNKAHTCCYAWIAYVTAWFRVYHREIFFAAQAQSAIQESGHKFPEEIRILSLDAARYGITFQQPCIRNRVFKFQPDPDNPKNILAPLDSIPGIGKLISKILKHPAPNTWEEAQELFRTTQTDNNQVEALAHSGALRNLDGIEEAQIPEGQKIPETPWTRISWEIPEFPAAETLSRTSILDIQSFLKSDNETAEVLGILTESKQSFNRKGYNLALADPTGTLAARCSQSLARKIAEDDIVKLKLTPGQRVLVTFTIPKKVVTNSEYEARPEIISVGEWPVLKDLPPLLKIILHSTQEEYEQVLNDIQEKLQDYIPGTGTIALELHLEDKTLEIALPWRVNLHPNLLQSLQGPNTELETYGIQERKEFSPL